MTERFAHKKSLGQHFLNNRAIPDRLCAAANLKPGDVVVEIGPGTGALTAILLEHPITVIAVETDERAITYLTERFASEIMTKRLVLVTADARTLTPDQLGLDDHGYKVVANIPYYLSGLLFRTFLESPCQPSELVFLVQREVAHRITRDPKASLLSLSVRAFGDPTYICTVGKGHFTPPPAVDSAIITVRNIDRTRLQNLDPREFFRVLHLGFGHKRKQLLGSLAPHFGREFVASCLETLNLPATVRGEDIPLSTWVALITQLTSEPMS